MAVSVGMIKSVSGLVMARNAQGEDRILKVGDVVNADETISTVGAGSSVVVGLADGKEIAIGGNEGVFLDKSVYASESFGQEAIVAEQTVADATTGKTAEEIQQALLRGEDVTNLEETAAGEGGNPSMGAYGAARYLQGGSENILGDTGLLDFGDGAIGGGLFGGNESIDVNDAPVAVSDAVGDGQAFVYENNSVAINVLPNDYDLDGDVLSINSFDTTVSYLRDGVLVTAGNITQVGGQLVFEPGTDFDYLAVDESQVVTFTYDIKDDSGADNSISNRATISITITGTNDRPVVEDININGENSEVSGVVGYYDMSQGQGAYSQVAGIERAGLEDVQLFTLSADELSGINTLYVQNPYGSTSEYLSQINTISQAVQNGMTLIIHDRALSQTNALLPGDHVFDVHYLSGNGYNIEIIDDGLETGLGGNINDSSLDGGNYSNHGYISLSSLPEGATVLMTDGDPSHIVTFSYSYGEGTVVYSTIPLDHYLNGNGNGTINANMQIYAANLLEDFVRDNSIYETHDGGESLPLDNDGNNIFTGALSATDLDESDTHTFRVVEDTLVITDESDAGIDTDDIQVSVYEEKGTWNYRIEGNFTELAAGETSTVTFQYVADDGHGFDGKDGIHESSVSEPKTITVTITGTNDQPVAVSDTEFPDANQATIVINSDNWSPSGVAISAISTLPGNAQVVETSGGLGVKSYNIDSSNIEGHALGTQEGITFKFDAVYNKVALTLSDIDSTDKVEYTALLKGVVVTSGTAVGQSEIGFDSIFFDTLIVKALDDGVFLSQTDFKIQSLEVTNNLLTTEENTSLTIDVLANDYDQDTNDNLNIYSVEYTPPHDSSVTIVENKLLFNPGTDFDYLGVGETAEVTFRYRVKDTSNSSEAGDAHNEASISEWATVTFTVIGTNDQPVIEVTNIGNLTELNGPSTLSATGVIAISDADVNDTLAIKFDYNDDIAWSNGDLTPSQVASLRSGFSISTTDTSAPSAAGTWTYTTSQNLDFLGAGETIKLSYTVYAKDDSGAVNNTSSSQVVTITIAGTNDQPVAVADSAIVNTFDAGNTEGVTVSAYYNGNANNIANVVTSSSGWGVKSSTYDDSDIDGSNRDDTIVFNFDQAFSSALIKLSNFDNNDNASWVAYNASGAVVASGTSSQSEFAMNGESITKIAITATGNNDDFRVESIETTVPLGTLENSAFTINVLANDYDIDVNDTFSINTFDVTTSHGGSISLSTDGKSLVFEPGTDFDYLAAGESQVVTFTYDIKDDSGITSNDVSTRATVTLTIMGTNDQPVVENIAIGDPEVVLVSENFQNGASGWNVNTTTNGGAELTSFLGRFGGSASRTSGDQEVFKTFDLGEEYAGQRVTVEFDMYEIDSWDGTGYQGEGEERFQVFVNGALVSNELKS
ncbi:MAG: retention module-containing protein, partial [Sulfurospirillaceae bacterium]|nr:retention module-containing protein [Sulfurospirillaceae bacterium]